MADMWCRHFSHGRLLDHALPHGILKERLKGRNFPGDSPGIYLLLHQLRQPGADMRMLNILYRYCAICDCQKVNELPEIVAVSNEGVP